LGGLRGVDLVDFSRFAECCGEAGDFVVLIPDAPVFKQRIQRLVCWAGVTRGSQVRRETLVLVKLDELERS
jgi:hypothetical protein